MMPVDNNKPMFGEQAKPLDATRAVSSIPTGSDDASAEKWVYPSPQMFYNAMRRKNWQPAEEDMNAIVAIHNATNERVWWVLDSRTLSAVRSFDARLSFRASIFYCLTAFQEPDSDVGGRAGVRRAAASAVSGAAEGL
jgi:hypothetical protein